MTLTEAYELLDLPEGTDLQQVRNRFIEQHSEYRMQIDNAPTPNLRQRYEKNLALREEAFALITGGSSLDDSQDLPSSAPYEEEKPQRSEAKGTDVKKANVQDASVMSLSDALALVGMQETNTPAQIISAYTSMKDDLEAELNRARTETIRQAYQTELMKLSQGWGIVDSWLKHKSQQQQQQQQQQRQQQADQERAQKNHTARNYETNGGDGASVENGVDQLGANRSSGKSEIGGIKKSYVWAASILVVVLVCGYFVFSTSEKNGDSKIDGQEAPTSANKDSIFLDKIAKLKMENPQDSVSLFKLYEEGAKDGIAECQYQYAWMLNAKNRQMERLVMLKKAEAQNHIKATSELANMYFEGISGVLPKNVTKAISLYEKAAAANNSVALLMLGIIYKQGTGVNQDVLEANNYFRRVIEIDDNPDAVKIANQEIVEN